MSRGAANPFESGNPRRVLQTYGSILDIARHGCLFRGMNGGYSPCQTAAASIVSSMRCHRMDDVFAAAENLSHLVHSFFDELVGGFPETKGCGFQDHSIGWLSWIHLSMPPTARFSFQRCFGGFLAFDQGIHLPGKFLLLLSVVVL